MAGTIEPLLDDVERSYREAQERMSDPAVYNDHREVADAGRKLKELEGPYLLAQRWREARADLMTLSRTAICASSWESCRNGSSHSRRS